MRTGVEEEGDTTKVIVLEVSSDHGLCGRYLGKRKAMGVRKLVKKLLQ